MSGFCQLKMAAFNYSWTSVPKFFIDIMKINSTYGDGYKRYFFQQGRAYAAQVKKIYYSLCTEVFPTLFNKERLKTL